MKQTLSDLTVCRSFKSQLRKQKHWNSQSLVTRTTNLVQFHELKNLDNELFISLPFPDIHISNNFESFKFPHPQIFINFLSLHKKSNNIQINKILLPYFLTPDFTSNDVLNSIAKSVMKTVPSLLQHFISHNDQNFAKTEWEKMYPSIQMDSHQKIKEDFKLKTLDDFQSLHLLACSLNCKFYLLFNLISPTNQNKSTIFASVVGPTNSKFCSYFLCESPSDLIYCKPINFIKNIKNSQRVSQNHFKYQLMKRMTLPLKKSCFYLNLPQILKKINEIGSNFMSISTHFIIDEDVSEPKLIFKLTDSLNIEIIHPNDDYSRIEILEKLNHISSSFATTEPAILEKISLPTIQKPGHFHSNSLLVLYQTKEKTINFQTDNKLNSHEVLENDSENENESQEKMKSYIKCSKKLSSLNDMSLFTWIFHKLNFSPPSQDSEFDIYQQIRFFSPFSLTSSTFESQFTNDPPIITTQTNNFSLANASKHPYGHFLCMHSIFNAAANSQTIFCKKCHKNRKSEERKEILMVPIRSKTSPFIKWICINCFDRLSKHEKNEAKSQFPMYHETVDVENYSQSNHTRMLSLNAAAERIYYSIMNLRSQPIGALRALIPRIDKAFIELTNIIQLFRQRMLRLKKITAKDLATIRDTDEYQARIGVAKRVVPLPDPDYEVIDFALFEQYLGGCFEEGTGITEYLLTQPESSMKQTLVDEAVKIMESSDRAISSNIDSIKISFNENEYKIELICQNNPNILEFKPKENVVQLKCENIANNIYEVFIVENGNHITSNAIFTLKSRKLLSGISLYKNDKILAIFNDEENMKTELYVLPFADCSIDYLYSPDFILEDIGNCEVSFSSDCTNIAILGKGSLDENPLLLLNFNEESNNWEVQNAGSFEATKLAWFSGDENVLFLANDNFHWIINFNSETETETNDNKTSNENEEEENGLEVVQVETTKHEGSLVKLVSSVSDMWAVYDNGDCFSILPKDTDDGEESQNEIENAFHEDIDHELEEISNNKISFKRPIIDACLSSEDDASGILVIDSNGEMIFQQFPIQMKAPPINISHTFEHQSYNFPMGIFDKKPHEFISSSQIALSLIEMFPVLVGYFFRFSFFLINNKFKSFHPSINNKNLSAMVNSFYQNELINTSLHHIEDSIHMLSFTTNNNINISMNNPCKILIFIDFGLRNSASFIDSIFGTSFAFCESDGIWISLRTTTDQFGNGFHYIIIYFKKNDFDIRALNEITLSSFLNLKNIFFLAENEKLIFDVLSNLDEQKILFSNISAYSLIFLRNSKQKQFEYKTIEASLNNSSLNIHIKVVPFEFYSDYSEIVINPKELAPIDPVSHEINEKWMNILNEIGVIDSKIGIQSIKNTIAHFATFYEFLDLDKTSLIKILKE
ncbi:hypothetical protein TRFO_33858 [Tritrichomonas foetus]|uniref:Uncharacterized protein n=1 Tax=Tritrichomonas foetus TaxID=1144522 RepID=A0A1J4JQ32_9EUKA|nr:hypothetical protein TRFO_33858 [Tritrichomonas foetus]|eukprot:OHS99627.1 hypothetical protein TRFO_33858 [Tritrichomonas foetus]